MARRNRRAFTDEQKADAVRLARELGSVVRAATDLDLKESALRNWVRQADADEGKGAEGALTSDEKRSCGDSAVRIASWPRTRDFLKMPAAFFAREEDRRSR